MFIKKSKFGQSLLLVLCLLCFDNTHLIARGKEQNDSLASSLFNKVSNPSKNKGYRNIAAFKDYFIAVGTDGRMDHINKSGEVHPIANPFMADLNSVICDSERVIAVGDEGTILVYADGEKCTKIESGTNKNINGIASFKGIFIAVADQGTILLNKSHNTWSCIKLALKGDIVSISAGTAFCIGVTNKGEIIKTSDGINWSIFDYNAEYEGYSKRCVFKSVVYSGNTIAIIGEHEDKSPVVLLSSGGNVWVERTLYYIGAYGKNYFLTNLPNNICFDALNDQFILVCDKGEVFSLPGCSKCNKSFTITENNLQGIMCSGNTLIMVGDNYFVNTINL